MTSMENHQKAHQQQLNQLHNTHNQQIKTLSESQQQLQTMLDETLYENRELVLALQHFEEELDQDVIQKEQLKHQLEQKVFFFYPFSFFF